MINHERNSTLFTIVLFSLTLSCLGYSSLTFAAIPTLDQVVARISTQMPQLMRLATAIGYVMGTFFLIKGIIELKHFGESRTMMSSERGISKPLILIAVGASLVYLPTSINTGLLTLWNDPVPFGYPVIAGNPWSELIRNSFVILQFIGVIAFLRGMIILTHLGGHGQPGQFGKALSHLIGGILCINMYDTIRMILTTLGLDQVLI